MPPRGVRGTVTLANSEDDRHSGIAAGDSFASLAIFFHLRAKSRNLSRSSTVEPVTDSAIHAWAMASNLFLSLAITHLDGVISLAGKMAGDRDRDKASPERKRAHGACTDSHFSSAKCELPWSPLYHRGHLTREERNSPP